MEDIWQREALPTLPAAWDLAGVNFADLDTVPSSYTDVCKREMLPAAQAWFRGRATPITLEWMTEAAYLADAVNIQCNRYSFELYSIGGQLRDIVARVNRAVTAATWDPALAPLAQCHALVQTRVAEELRALTATREHTHPALALPRLVSDMQTRICLQFTPEGIADRAWLDGRWPGRRAIATRRIRSYLRRRSGEDAASGCRSIANWHIISAVGRGSARFEARARTQPGGWRGELVRQVELVCAAVTAPEPTPSATPRRRATTTSSRQRQR